MPRKRMEWRWNLGGFLSKNHAFWTWGSEMCPFWLLGMTLRFLLLQSVEKFVFTLSIPLWKRCFFHSNFQLSNFLLLYLKIQSFFWLSTTKFNQVACLQVATVLGNLHMPHHWLNESCKWSSLFSNNLSELACSCRTYQWRNYNKYFLDQHLLFINTKSS